MSFLDSKRCNRSYICPLCQKSYDTPCSLAEHYVSTWHERKEQSSEPQEQNGAICLSSFLKAHMKEDTIVGLEYVMEMKKDSSYTYTCRLCKEMNTNLPTIVQHIVNLMHTERYIDKHYKYLLPPYRDRDRARRGGRRSEYVRALRDAAVMITEQQGSKEIQVVLLESDGKTAEDPPPSKPESDGKTSEDPPPSKPESDGKDIKNNCPLPSTGNDLQTEHTKERLPRDSVPQEKGSHVKIIKATFPKYTCFPCKITCSSAVNLCQHIIGSKHKTNLLLTQEQDDANRLSSFLNAHMKEDPIVGLEYVMEVKQGSLYKFSCQLCGVVDVDLMKIVGHITDLNHIECYALKHYSHMFSPLVPGISPNARGKALRKIAATITTLQGCKKIQVKSTSVGGLTESALFPGGDGKTKKAAEDTIPSKPKRDRKTRKAFEDTLPSKRKGGRKKRRKAVKDTLPSKHKSRSSHSKWSPLSYQEKSLYESHESHRYSKMPKVSKSDDPPLAKRIRLSPEGDWDALPSRSHISKHRSSHYESQAIRMDCTTAMQELEFRTNEEFFNYVSNFVISNEEDAVFIRTITQNCIRAMTNFEVEEAERQKTTYHSETPLAHTSRTTQEIPDILENKTESHSWGSEMTLLKDTSNPPSESMPKNEVTDFFFSSIKNMDESEVVGVFQKIATTNPEFQGMDIPSVMRFLKNSGRLNKP
ncbi:uncharacterized protein LOC120937843 [Rana temporaria]|uniref:uncharacterized protein LOC120937843 n=1 Tax=Rana temporaria TaxID=8407 RepID=UPI001AADF8BA|nr:uncharacterized protein LOC120937843 [Rana temporaria]